MMDMIFPGRGIYMNMVNFAAEYLLILFFFRTLDSRPQRIRRWAGRILLIALALLYFLSPDVSDSLRQETYRFVDQLSRLAFYFLPVYGYLRLTKGASWRRACYLSLYYIFFYEMAYIYRHTIGSLAMTRWSALPHGTTLAAAGFGAVLLVELFFAWMVSRFVPLERIAAVGVFRMFFVVSMNLVSLFLKYSMMQQSVTPEVPVWDQILYPLLAGFSMEFIMVFFESYQAIDEDRRALQVQKEMRNYELETARKSAAADQNVRQLYHDMKNHLLAIRAMQRGEGDAAAYIDSILDKLEVSDELVSTGLPYLDAYLTQKVSALKGSGIKCHVALDLEPLAFLAPVDMISIIGNGVDNAGEALGRLPEDQRLLMVKSSRFANMTILQFTNPFDGRLKWSNGRLTTLKQDSTAHGIGLKTVQRVAEKYGGTMSVDADGEKKRFQLTVMIPLPDEPVR